MEPGSSFGQGHCEGHKYVNVLTIILRMLLFLHLLHLKCIDDDLGFFSCHLNYFLFPFVFVCGRFLHAKKIQQRWQRCLLHLNLNNNNDNDNNNDN